MAIVTNGGSSYVLAGATSVGRQNREDLSDFITNISPTETPFISGLAQTTASAVLHEWLSHSLAAAAATNVAIEGNETTLDTPTTLTRTTNFCQINSKAVAISGTQDKVSKAGMGTELAYRVLLHTKEIKRDMETAALQNTAGDSTAGTASAARRIKGFEEFVVTNTSTITVTITQALLNTELSNVWTQGGNPDCLIVNAANKINISDMTPGSTKNVDALDRRLTSAVDIYESDFGVLKVVPDRFDNTQTIKICETDLWRVAVLRPLEVQALGKTGDTTKRLLTTEWTLECRAENGNGMITTP